MERFMTIDEARQVLTEHSSITADQFLSILRLRGYDVDDLQPVREKVPKGATKCDDCNATILVEQITRCESCNSILCTDHVYVCSSCKEIFCAEHIKRFGSSSLLCSHCEWEQNEMLSNLNFGDL